LARSDIQMGRDRLAGGSRGNHHQTRQPRRWAYRL